MIKQLWERRIGVDRIKAFKSMCFDIQRKQFLTMYKKQQRGTTKNKKRDMYDIGNSSYNKI